MKRDMKRNMKMGIIGFGHMGQAMTHALIKRGWRITASVHKSPVNHPYFKNHAKCCKGKISLITSNEEVLRGVFAYVLAVRPAQTEKILNEITKTKSGKSPVLISIVAGKTVSFLRKNSGAKKIIRAMPNLPAQIGAGMSVWKSSGLNSKEKNTIKKILQSFGEEIEVKNENLINSATAISGSGPGYVFAFLDTLEKSAVKLGFSKDQAGKLILQTVLGSCEYAKIQTTGHNLSFEDLAEQVQTKGGTTEAAFKILKKTAWRKNLVKAILAAYMKAKKL